MKWLLVFYFLELGIITDGGYIAYEEEIISVTQDNNIYVNMQMTMELFNLLYITGGVYTDTYANNIFSYFPFHSSYLFETGVEYGKIKIGFQHICSHQTVPRMWILLPDNYYDLSRNSFFIRVSNNE